jgi:hypothetical protein
MRVVHPYSIVPGGVHSAQEVREAVATDPVVARHYRDLAIDSIRLEQVTGPRTAYVSYRRRNNVYWTKRKLTLHPGETLLSDGKNQVRARCGNRISDWEQSPVLDEEPDEEVLDQPVPIAVPEQLLAQDIPWDRALPLIGFPAPEEPFPRELLPASPLLPPGTVPLLVESKPEGKLVPEEPYAVPEPGTLLLVGTGLAGAIWRLRRVSAHRAR